MVAIGTLISTFWILASNSWMQTPQGFEIVDGHVVPTDWFKIIFNPSFPYRLAHMAIAAFIVAALVVAATGAWHLLKGRRDKAVTKMFSMALGLLLVLAPLQAVVGDQHGLNTLLEGLSKVAALEGDFDSVPGQPLILFGWPDMRTETTDYEVAIPHLGALVLTHTWNGSIRGLKSFPPEDRPYAPVVFFAFRIMVGLGLLMAAVGLAGLVQRIRGRLYHTRWLLRAMIAMGPAGFVALLAGWTVTEVGRQPFTVYGMLRTADSVSPIALPGVAASFLAFAGVYLIVFGAGLVYFLRLMSRPPVVGEQGPPKGVPVRSAGITPAPSLHDGRTEHPVSP
jgi:cytochrome d ubiquinol oxidase subunit I